MLTQLAFRKPTTSFTSPPSRALANYAKASTDTAGGPSDSVTLSEQAKQKPESTSGLRKLGTVAALGLSFLGIMGTVGCAGGTATTATPPETETVQQTNQEAEATVDLSQQQTQTTSREQTGPQLHPNLRGRSAEDIAENVGQEGRKVGKHIIDGLEEGTENLVNIFKGKDAEEVAENLGAEGRKIGKQIGEEGKKIGQEAAEVGKEIGDVAKGFWRGLTGKGKK